jgi:hypothetical protein
MTIDQIAREIATVVDSDLWVRVNDRNDLLEAVLRRHWPAGAGVVEVTKRDVIEAFNVASGRNVGDYDKTVAEELNRTLRARAVPAVGRVVPRPVREVSQLVVPEKMGLTRTDRVVIDAPLLGLKVVTLSQVEWGKADVTRWCIPGQPWIERTTTREPRAWEEADLPPLDTGVSAYKDGQLMAAFGPRSRRSYITQEINAQGIDALVVLPATLEGGK